MLNSSEFTMQTNIEEAADDFSKFLTIDMNERLRPINQLIEDMHARLEEFQTMVYFAKQERIIAVSLMTTISNTQRELSDLFQRIDSVENLVEHVRSTLNALEKDVEKAEEEVGYTESATSKVANIFTPLFKKSPDVCQPSSNLQSYKTSDYFHPSDESNETKPDKE